LISLPCGKPARKVANIESLSEFICWPLTGEHPADVALITSLRDGMNLVSYEYVACQSDNAGVLVLSEFAGAAQSLGAGAPHQPPKTLLHHPNTLT
jgi:hypothetical protein